MAAESISQFLSKRPGHCFSEQPLRFVYNRVYWNVRYQKQFFEDPADTPDKQRKIRRLVHSGYRSWYRRLPAHERRVELLDERVCSAATPDEWRLLLDKVIDNFVAISVPTISVFLWYCTASIQTTAFLFPR